MCGGSALDGWSDADDLFPMLHDAPAAGGGGSSGGAGSAGGGSSPLGRHSAGAQAGGWGEEECGTASLAAWAGNHGTRSALTAALGPEQQQQLAEEAEVEVTEEHGTVYGTVSMGVQTAAGGGGEGSSAGLGVGGMQLMQLADMEAADGGSWEESDSPQGYVMPSRPNLFDERAGPGEYEEVPRQRDCSTQTPPPHLLHPLRTAHGGGGAQGGRAAAAAGPVVTADSTLPDIQAAFGHQGGPALHNRLGASHPFGPSYLYAYRGVVFEVLQSGLIATVTLFRP